MESLPWRCGSCGAQFLSEDAAPRCPKCLKQSLVARHEPAPVPEPAWVPRREPEAPPEPDRAPGATLFLACVPAVVIALLVSGWLGRPLDPLLAIVFAVVTAPLAGWIGARGVGNRIHASVAAMIGSVGIVVANAYYLRGRPHLVNVELLLPMVIGALPGAALFVALRALEERPLVRALLALAATAATAFVVIWV